MQAFLNTTIEQKKYQRISWHKVNKNRYRCYSARRKYWFGENVLRIFFSKKMAKYLSENSEWYFDAVNKDHRFYFWRDRRRWEIGKKNI